MTFDTRVYAKLSIAEGPEPKIDIDGTVVEFEQVGNLSSKSGYHGRAYKNLSTGEIVVVHEGSQDLSHNVLQNWDKVVSDWGVTNTTLAAGFIPEQFYDAFNFLNDVIANNPGTTIIQDGQSLGGTLAQMLGSLEVYKDIETITFNPYGSKCLQDNLEKAGFFLSDDNSNITNYSTNKEIVTNLREQVGDTYEATNGPKYSHNVEAHIEEDLHYELKTYDRSIDNMLKIYANIDIEAGPDGKFFLHISYNEDLSTNEYRDLLNNLNHKGYLNDDLRVKDISSGRDTTYEIKDGDTIWDICEKYGMSYDDLIDANDWLEDRFSDDKDFALIRPGEKLKIPDDFVKPDGSDDGDDDGSGSGHGHDNDDFFNEFNPDGKNDRWRDTFDGATTVEPIYLDPLLVDLNGDGIKTTDIHNGTYFDHDNNSFAEKTAWVSSDDGILVFDKNNDGIINNGNEVFGDNFTKADGSKASSGFDALASLDSNNDGVINSGDEMFNSIKILKGDGTLMTLSEAGITSISLASSESGTVDENGNTQLRISSFTKADGSTGEIGDYSFVRDPFYSVSTDVVDVPQDIQALPDASGYGFVQSLRQAMAKDASGELKALVQSFIAETNLTQKREILTNIIYKWAGTDTLEADSRGGFVDARALSALEKFSAKEYTGIPSQGSSEVHNPNEQAANIVNAAFSSFRETVYAQLASQTSLKSLFDLITFEVDIDSQELSLNLNDVTNYIKNQISLDKQSGDNLLSDFDRVFKNLGLTSNSNYQEYYDEFVSLDSSYKSLLDTSDKFVTYGTDENDSMTGSAIDEAFFGGSGDDTIYSRQGNDIVYGGDGDDYIDTCEGDDIVYGGNGNDTILGGEGNDLLYGEDGDDNIQTGGGHDTVYGGAGNDTIFAVSGTGYLNGGEGNDIITVGSRGNFTIEGGRGDDILTGATENYIPNETNFIYNLGDGNDTIYANVNIENIIFGEGITLENTRFQALPNEDIVITFANCEGSITIKEGVRKFNERDSVVFADGTRITGEELDNYFAIYGTEGDDVIEGTGESETIYGLGGDDTISSGPGNDTIYGGDGNDTIDGYGGNNYIDGGAGNDTIYAGGTGQSTIIGGLGDDILHAHSGNSRGNITTFIYNLGDGNDVIIPYVNECILSLGEGITRENIRFEAQNSADVKISFENAEGSITLQNWLNRQEDLSKIILSDGSMVSFSDIVNNLQIHGSEADDTIEGTSRNEKIYGYGGNDIINAGGGDDTIYGGAGNDTITSSGGSNVIYGDEGNDTISIDGRGTSTITGGAGDDEIYGYNDDYSVTNYVYNLGDGSDTIYNRGGTTVLNLGEGITKDNIRFTESGNDVLITFADQPGSITVKDGMEYSMFTNINFADGTSYNKDEIMSRTALYGTEGNDVINASNRTQVIYGLGGDDIINGQGRNNTIYGGDGNDTINGVDGSNYLDGGAGNDTIYAGEDGQSILIGGLGDDILHGQSRNTYGSSQTTYIYNSGDGNDTIFNGCNQHLCFGEGISKDNIVFSAEDKTLKITFTDREGSITINEGMYSWNAFIEFSFADGTSYTGLEAIDLANQSTVSDSQVNQIIQDMTAYSNSNDIQISNIQTQQNNTDLLTLVAPGINS